MRRALLILVSTIASLAAARAADVEAVTAVAGAGPRVVNVCPVSADTLAVTIRHGKVTPGHQEPYVAQKTDQLKPWRYHNWLERDGKVIGTLAGVKHDVLYIAPKLEDQPLGEEWASNPASYLCVSVDDAAFAGGQRPVAVHRKARATDLFRTDTHSIQGPREHLIYLKWPADLTEGASYQLRFEGHDPAIEGVSYKHDPLHARSEAVHVSQTGFRPDDPLKVAFLSLWEGDGGGHTYPAGLAFNLIRESDGRGVYRGKAVMGLAADQVEVPGKVNHNGTDVWRLDFSDFAEPGEYRVYVEGVGCSYPFSIANNVWEKAWWVSVRGLYHQRSGIELGPPYTTYVRPRAFHPDDGVQILLNKAAYVEPSKSSGPEALFERLAAGATEQVTREAWGGYMDAGDFDRRAEHLVASRWLLDLLAAYPAMAKANLNIPESGNALPDLLDEALWGLDCYRRMQQPDGSVPGGIESAEHPKVGETSWQESHPIYQYAPDPWATGLYAATAAQAAKVLQGLDRDLAGQYQKTALAAMEYVERLQAEGKLEGYDTRVADARNLAAANLYILTGDDRWHDIYKQTCAFTKAQGRTNKWQQFDQGEAIFAYLQLPEGKTDATIRKWGTHAVLNEASQLVAAGKETAFGWTGSPAVRIGWGRLTSPRHCIPLVWAYRLTGESKYLEAMVRACQYPTGANPLNLCFTTGLGKQTPEHVFIGDAILTNQPTPPGITPLGPQEWMLLNQWWLNPHARAYPALKNWPTCENYIDAGLYTCTGEPTIHGSIAPTFYMWGHLAARPAMNGK